MRNKLKVLATETVTVSLGERSYAIQIGAGLLTELGERCRKLGLGSSCAIITDRNVGVRYAGAAAESLEIAGFQTTVITLPPGEKVKALRYVGDCYDKLARSR